MLFWQQRELTDKQVFKQIRIISLCIHTCACANTHAHACVCIYKNPNTRVCEYLLNRIYQFPNFSRSEGSGINKILLYLCWFCAPSNPSCLFLLSMLDHTALWQYQKWYANCRESLKMRHNYSLKYKDFIS